MKRSITEGIVEYTGRILVLRGYSLRRTLVVLEAVVSRRCCSSIGGTLHVELQDNTATKTLWLWKENPHIRAFRS